ncbi:MAG TPA: YciI family protein [Chitinophagaceae bacterium]|nr:YciI family protein [Chitinophagaceae bacterium]
MKKLLFVLSLILTAPSFAQDSTKVKMKEWLGVLTLTEKYTDEKNWTEKDQAIVGEHFQRLIKKKNEGVVILAGRTQTELNNTEGMGLVIFYAKDEKEALQFMTDDPAVKNKIMKTKVLPYSIALNKCD